MYVLRYGKLHAAIVPCCLPSFGGLRASYCFIPAVIPPHTCTLAALGALHSFTDCQSKVRPLLGHLMPNGCKFVSLMATESLLNELIIRSLE